MHEIMTVVEHPAFASLYREQLHQEGLEIVELDAEEVTRTTVTIFPDAAQKDLVALEVELPSLTGGFLRTAKLHALTVEDVRKAFAKYRPLALGEVRTETLQYEERHLFTDEVVKRMEIRLPLLENPIGAIAFFREELEAITALKGTHVVLAPLLETFLTEFLFGQKIELFDPRLLSRLSQHHDVREHIRATFVPLIVSRTTTEVKRMSTGEAVRLSEWKPFQVTHSSVHPAIPAVRTLFNLVPCNRKLEVAFAQTLIELCRTFLRLPRTRDRRHSESTTSQISDACPYTLPIFSSGEATEATCSSRQKAAWTKTCRSKHPQP